MKIVFKITCAAAVLIAAPASADRRPFTFTYEYPTQPEDNVEIELWNTQARDGLGEDSGASTVQQQIEIEYGITDHTSVSLYQTVEQGGGEGLHYGKTKLEVRHRLAERGQWPVDVTLYGELAKPFGKPELEVEPKLILARDFGRVTVAVNLIGEVEIEREREASGEKVIEAHLVPGWAAGITYEVMPQLKLGAETWGEIATPFADAQTYAWAGPAISWAPSTTFWAAATGGLGLNDRSADLIVRFILAVGL
jgi:hypothetical protein